MDIVNQWITLREAHNNEEAAQLLADDASFVTPNNNVTGREEILTFINARAVPKDGPVFEKEFVESCPGVFVRGATVKRMMMTVKLTQTITIVDGRISLIVLER